MILLLGATSYIGQGFARALRRRKDSFVPLSRRAFDYTRFEFLFDYVRKLKPDLVINADETGSLERWSDGGGNGNAVRAGHAEARNLASSSAQPHPSAQGHEIERAEMLQINTLLPQTIARVCATTNTPFGHVSTGSIYVGAKVQDNGNFRIEDDFGAPTVRTLINSRPELFRGFSESDAPNCTFNSQLCTFYSGTKALAEEALHQHGLYIWRLRLPFNENDDPNNFLTRLQDGSTVHDALNSVSHLDECVAACLELWERHAPLGIYNVVNPEPVRTQEVIQMIRRFLRPSRELQLLVYGDDAGHAPDRFPHSDCVLDCSKLLGTGIALRPARDALDRALQKWVPQSASIVKTLA